MNRDGNLILGVDPGLTGAIAILDFVANDLRLVSDMPVYTNERKGKHGLNIVDFVGIQRVIKPFARNIALAIVEEVGAMPNQGLSSTFKFGWSTGVVTGVIAGHDIPVMPVMPAIWKTVFGLTRDKKLSRDLAMREFGIQAEKYFSRAKDDGRAEAALLCRYGERFLR